MLLRIGIGSVVDWLSQSFLDTRPFDGGDQADAWLSGQQSEGRHPEHKSWEQQKWEKDCFSVSFVPWNTGGKQFEKNEDVFWIGVQLKYLNLKHRKQIKIECYCQISWGLHWTVKYHAEQKG